jgi:hypothetical protein
MIHVIGRRKVEDLIIASADGALGAADDEALEAHLATCAECSALARQHVRLAERLTSPIGSDVAERLSLERLHASDRVLSATFWTYLRRSLVAGAFVMSALLVAAGAVSGVNEAVGRLTIPERELVSEQTAPLGTDTVILRVEDGRFAAGPGQTSGVLVSADLQLTTRRAGSAELRFARPGESYGVLGGAPDLTGVSKLHIENRIPSVDSITTYEIWLHIEAPDPVDSQHILVTVEPTHGGSRAHIP